MWQMGSVYFRRIGYPNWKLTVGTLKLEEYMYIPCHNRKTLHHKTTRQMYRYGVVGEALYIEVLNKGHVIALTTQEVNCTCIKFPAPSAQLW